MAYNEKASRLRGKEADAEMRRVYGRLHFGAVMSPETMTPLHGLKLGLVWTAVVSLFLLYSGTVLHSESLGDSLQSFHMATVLLVGFVFQADVLVFRRGSVARLHSYFSSGFDYESGFLEEYRRRASASSGRRLRDLFFAWECLTRLSGLLELTGSSLGSLLLGSSSSSSEPRQELWVRTWLPCACEGGLSLWTVHWVQWTGVALGALLPTLAVEIFVFTAEGLCLEMRVLAASLRGLRRRATTLVAASTSSEKPLTYSQAYERCLATSVRHHLEILEAYGEFAGMVSRPLTTILVAGSVMIACDGIAYFEASGRLVLVAKSALLFVTEVTALYLLCSWGERIYETSLDVGKAMYESDWTGLEGPRKRGVLVVLEAGKRPLVVSAGGLVRARVVTFASIVNAAYSYFNILKTLDGKTEGL